MGTQYTAKAESVVTLNGKAAEQTLTALTRQAVDLRKALKAAEAVGDTKKVRELERDIKAADAAIKAFQRDTKSFEDILSNIDGSTLKQLTMAARSLEKELRNLAPDTEAFVTKSKQLRAVKARIEEVNAKLRESHNWLQRTGEKFNKYFAMVTAAAAGVTGLSMSLRKAAEEAAEMDDRYSDVMKTTGLTREQVVQLNDAFMKMDTRTSRDNLNLLARDAGKLGISGTKDVLEFVRAADKINVALGEDLGEGAIRNIGKMADVFGLTKKMGIEKAFTSIGSAVNALGQDSTAAEATLVDFTQRLSGVAAQAGISIQNILGFASAMDQSGIKVEMGATAFQKFIMKMYEDTATFAKYAKMEVGDFSNLLQKDANQAIMTVLRSLNEAGGFAALVPIFKDMGTDGARAVSALAALASNLGAAEKAQKLANIEFAKATSLANEFDVKNNNRMAQLDKARKKWKDQVVLFGEQLSPAFLKTTKASTLALKVLMQIPAPVYAITAAAGALVVVWKSWNTICATGNKIGAAAKVVFYALQTAVLRLTGATTAATAAQAKLNAAFAASGIGAVVTLVAALAAGVVTLTRKLTEGQREMRKIREEFAASKLEAEGLLTIIEKNAAGTDAYKEAITTLSEKYGDYIGHLIDEKGELTDINEARSTLNTLLEREMYLRMQKQATDKITSDYVKREARMYDQLVRSIMRASGMSEENATIVASQMLNYIRMGEDARDKMKELYGIDEKDLRAHLLQMKLGYENYIKSRNATNARFSGLMPTAPATPGSAEFIGPMPKTGGTGGNNNPEPTGTPYTAPSTFKEAKRRFQESWKQAKLDLARQYEEGELTKKQYDQQSLDLTLEWLKKQRNLYERWGQSTASVTGQIADAMRKKAEMSLKETEKQEKELRKILSDIEKEGKKASDKVAAEEQKALDKEVQGLTDPETEAEIKRIHESFQQAETLRKELREASWDERYAYEMGKLKELRDGQFITEQEYEKKVAQLKLQNAQQYTSKVASLTQSLVEISTSLQDLEQQKLEARKADELRLYGDTADKRAEIENKYEKEQLALQKKYADVDMVLKIANATASGAVAAVRAYEEGGPYAGPVLAALVAATTALQIGTIIAQRNAIKNATVDSGSSTATVGTRVLAGYSSGGYTGSAASDDTPAGVVHANEWVAPAAMVRAEPVLFADLERRRRQYALSAPAGSAVQGYATGGYTGQDGASVLTSLMEDLLEEYLRLKKEKIRAYVVLRDLHEAENTEQRFKEVMKR